MKKLIVEPKYTGKNLITYLTTIFPNLNVNSIYKALRKKDIKLSWCKIKSENQSR